MTERIFEKNAPLYSAAGYWPRPIQYGGKACKIRGWQNPDPELTEGERQGWLSKYGADGIGLLLGSPFFDGTVLGALDIDQDDYVRVAAVLLGGNPPCGRFGSKGIAYFVRLRGDLGKAKHVFEVNPPNGRKLHIGELLGPKSLLVIPPSIHPDTQKPYLWKGKPLLDTPFTELPIIEV